MTFLIAKLSYGRGEMWCDGRPQKTKLEGANPWDCLEREYISKGYEYTSRKSVHGYDPAYAILLHQDLGFVGVWTYTGDCPL